MMKLFSKLLMTMALAALVAGLAGCPSGDGDGGNGGGSGTSGGGTDAEVSLSGAGASFPAPLYNRWFQDYNKKHPNVKIEYQSVGSGTGIKRFIDELVDFGASDAAMKDEEMAQVSRGVQLLPMTAGSVVLAYNLPGVEELKLSRAAYAGIFLGTVAKWNDEAIAASNPGVTLPDMAITPVQRSDGSGTTFVFTNHLADISADFKDDVGAGKSVTWPAGIQAPKNDGVAAGIAQTPGAIGYVEYGYAKTNNLKTASLENKAGKYVAPTAEAASKALGAVELPENFRAFVTDPEGEDSYPIVTYTWLLCYKQYDDAEKLAAMKDVINYCLTEGQKISTELGYIPLPENVVKKVQAAVDNIEAK